jgi:myo-inositol-1-phosphate synthase
MVGLLALQAGVPPIGCVTAGPPFDRIPLAGWTDIQVGGHDIVDTPLGASAQRLVNSGVIPASVYSLVRASLMDLEAQVRPGYCPELHDGSLREAVSRLASDISEFRVSRGLERVVVINVASTEPPFPRLPEHEDVGALRAALMQPGPAVLPPSSVVACAAFEAGCGFVDFTPSLGARIPALAQMAAEYRVPFAGSDGKTGQTLLRTALAPMFTARALHVLSWAGVNILGGGDGATLGEADNARSKLSSKRSVLPLILGEAVTAPLHIDNVPELGDLKVAWDHILFEGFLGVKMSMQVTWSGIDSALAAPLVLDLTRLVAAAHGAGEHGALADLAFFFKDPVNTSEHALSEQRWRLARWAYTLAVRQYSELQVSGEARPDGSQRGQSS